MAKTPILIKFDHDLIKSIDSTAKYMEMSRSEWVREACKAALRPAKPLDRLICLPRVGAVPEWTGTLSELIKYDNDNLDQDAELNGLPCDPNGYALYEQWTIEHWRIATDNIHAHFI